MSLPGTGTSSLLDWDAEVALHLITAPVLC
jgi:hypothetical protein